VTVRIRGANEIFLNGTFQITVTGSNTFTYSITDASTGTGTGTITTSTTTIPKSTSDRQLQIVAKLGRMSCQTGQDFIDLADFFGFTITVTPGIDDVSGTVVGLTDTEKRFTIVVNSPLSSLSEEFPLTFPIFFGNVDAQFLQCLLQDCDQSNCQILFNFTGNPLDTWILRLGTWDDAGDWQDTDNWEDSP